MQSSTLLGRAQAGGAEQGTVAHCPAKRSWRSSVACCSDSLSYSKQSWRSYDAQSQALQCVVEWCYAQKAKLAVPGGATCCHVSPCAATSSKAGAAKQSLAWRGRDAQSTAGTAQTGSVELRKALSIKAQLAKRRIATHHTALHDASKQSWLSAARWRETEHGASKHSWFCAGSFNSSQRSSQKNS